MTKKVLLVLAASVYQLETITTAKTLGYSVITVDNQPDNPGHKFADKSYNIDITDYDAILDLAKKEKIDGIIAACTDIGVPTAAYVADRLGLIAPPWPEAKLFTDKWVFHNFLKEEGLLIPNALQITKHSVIDNTIFTRDGVPVDWILKPTRSSGAKGIFVLNSIQAFEHCLAESFKYAPNGVLIFEEFIHGRQGTCEGVVRGGEIFLCIITDRLTWRFPYVTTSGHKVPSGFSDKIKTEIISLLSLIFSKLRYIDGPFDCDFVVKDNNVYILEVSPRIGGNSLSKLLKNSIKFDIIEYSIKCSLRIPFFLSYSVSETPSAILILGVPQAGMLDYPPQELKSLLQEDWVIHLTFDKAPGDVVLPFSNSRHRIGEAMLQADTISELDARITEFYTRLNIKAG